MTLDSLQVELQPIVSIGDIDLVLISDPRSFYFADLLIHIATFRGIILCTDPVYRLGRMFVREISQLLRNRFDPLPTTPLIMPLRFMEPFAFGEICLIPHANGCGLGGCNWLITKGVDPELVDFSAFVITGFCEPLIRLFPAPHPLPRVNVVAVLPSAIPIQSRDNSDSLESVAQSVLGHLKDRKKVIVSTFVDDQLYSILYYLRITKAISHPFGIASYSWDPLMDIMTSM
jgi:hypothetical protein